MSPGRLEDLRRRVQHDPSSIAFAQLAEEYRRDGQLQEAVDVCRAGLAIHPTYLSARVTLGRALLELHHLDEAQAELDKVLTVAPENLAAIRGLAEINHRRGALPEALAHYRAALLLARHDPDLEQTVTDLAAQLNPEPPEPEFEEPAFERNAIARFETSLAAVAASRAAEGRGEPAAFGEMAADPNRLRTVRIVAALEQWLQALNASGVERHA
jgi:tetratricopeptide (TPR) repeat protein